MTGHNPRRPWVRGLVRFLLTASLSPWILLMLWSRPAPVRAQVATKLGTGRFATPAPARMAP